MTTANQVLTDSCVLGQIWTDRTKEQASITGIPLYDSEMELDFGVLFLVGHQLILLQLCESQ